jgi:hypothetical protein
MGCVGLCVGVALLVAKLMRARIVNHHVFLNSPDLLIRPRWPLQRSFSATSGRDIGILTACFG